MKVDRQINRLLVLFLFIASLGTVGCSKMENMYEKFAPEILFKRLVVINGGQESWEVSPDATTITLGKGISVWTVRARVSAPNGLSNIQLMKVTDKEELLEQYSEFTTTPNVSEIEYALEGITSETIIRVKALDTIGNTTVKDFKIIPQ